MRSRRKIYRNKLNTEVILRHHFVSAVQTTMCKCVHFRVKFGAVFEAGLKADWAILSYISFNITLSGQMTLYCSNRVETS